MIPSDLVFNGPFALWPDEAGHWPVEEAAAGPGVYLLTVKVGSQDRAYYIGEAEHIGNRLREHLSSYLAGQYWLYSASSLREGRLEPSWKPPLKAEQVLHQLAVHHAALREMLPLVNVYVARMERPRADRQRVESAMISALRQHQHANVFLENERLSVLVREGQVPVGVHGCSQVLGIPEVLLV